MTLEDFFTLTEMKDGLTAPARVEELVSVMKKEKDTLVKNVGDATRHWAAVASTIAATENKECLDLFVQLDGLWFIDRWLKDAQTFGTEIGDCFVEEAISALLQAVEKLQIDKERLISSGICVTVESLVSYRSTRVQNRARALSDGWKAKVADSMGIGAEKAAVCDPKLNDEHLESQSNKDDFLSKRSPGDQKLECTEGEMIKPSNDQDSSQITSDHADSKDGCPHTVASPDKLKCVENDVSAREEVCPSEAKLNQQGPSDPKQGASDVTSEVLKSNHEAEPASPDNKIESLPDRLGKMEVSSVSAGTGISSRNDVVVAEGATAKPDADSNDATDDLSVQNTSSKDTNLLVGESRNEMNDSGGVAQKGLSHGDGCCTVEETKDQGTTSSRVEDVDKYNEAKRRRKSKKKYFGNTGEFARLSKTSKNHDIIRQTPDMDLEYGTVDALEVARLVAKEVEREVVGYDEQSGSSSSSSERVSSDDIRQPDSPESINGGQDPPSDELPTMENLSPRASDKEPLINSADQDTNLKNHTHDTESSQLTDAVRDPETIPEKSVCGFDLNEEFSSEELDHNLPGATTVSNPVSVVSASRAVMASGKPSAPLQFEGTLGWKGSAATSAFRPASPRRASDSEKALSGGATSSGSRQRQDFLDFDLNVAEGGGDGKFFNLGPSKQTGMLPGLPSGESSVELSPKRSERLKFDLNQIGEDGDVPAFEWKIGGRMSGTQNCRRSPSPASSSSCIQPSLRNFDLNDNPTTCNNLTSQHPFFSEPSAHHKVIPNPHGVPTDDSVISILGTKVKKNTFPPQTSSHFPNGRASEPMMDASLLRGGPLMGLGPAIPYPHSIYGYNGLAVGPGMPFPSGPIYGSGGPIPYMFDSRGAHVMPNVLGPTSNVPPSYGQPFMMNMMGVNAAPGSNGAGFLRPNLDLNAGFSVEGGSGRDPGFFRQFLNPGQGRPLEEQLRDSFRPLSSGASGGKRKEPDTGWELYPTNYKHQQPPHL